MVVPDETFMGPVYANRRAAITIALAVFDALQVLLPTASGGDAAEILDGKVIALSAHEGAPTALVRFTGIDWDTQARIEAIARRDRRTT